MDTPLMPDPASGETPPEAGVPAPDERGGLPGAGSAPELAPDLAAPQPWTATPPAPGGRDASGGAPPPWPQGRWGAAAGGPPPAPPGRRGLALAFGGALIAGGVAGAIVMGTLGNASSRSATTSTPVTTPAPVQQLPFGGRFGNPYSGGTGSPGSSGPSSSGASSIDAASIAAKVDPAIVDITSNLSGGTAEGTGMVITSGGQVLTNNHVVQGATFITAQVAGTGRKYTATVVGTDPADDVALLQLQGASNLKTITAGDPSKVATGDPVLAIGNALGRGGTPAVAAGNVVAVGQTITATDDTGANAETLTNLIQVDANVQPGDSGGPLVDASGKVIGMDTAASSSGRGFRFRGTSAQGFAIPIDTAMSIVQQLRNGGGAPMTTAQTSLLGVEVADASSQGTTGALVVGIAPGTPAESAGLAAGDVIVTFGGRSITSPSTLTTAVRATKPGDRVQVAWLDQNGQQHSATVQLAAQSAPAA
jgi:S1-C subfamily serine protease